MMLSVVSHVVNGLMHATRNTVLAVLQCNAVQAVSTVMTCNSAYVKTFGVQCRPAHLGELADAASGRAYATWLP